MAFGEDKSWETQPVENVLTCRQALDQCLGGVVCLGQCVYEGGVTNVLKAVRGRCLD